MKGLVNKNVIFQKLAILQAQVTIITKKTCKKDSQKQGQKGEESFEQSQALQTTRSRHHFQVLHHTRI